MNNRDLKTLLRQIKDAPEFGGLVDRVTVEKNWSRLSQELGFTSREVTTPTYGWRAYAEYASHVFGSHVLRPASLALSAFVLMFGGWVTTVNASFDAVPGDVLYPVKLATERVQITFATTSERRARLHTEFAGRRLQEVAEITSSTRDEKDARVRTAVAGFRNELASANEQLSQTDVSDPDSTAIAMVIDRKADEYEAVIARSESTLPEGTRPSVADALIAVEAVDAHAISSLVTSHEATQQSSTAEHLESSFQETYNTLKVRLSIDIGRLDVITGTLKETPYNVRTPLLERIADARVALGDHDALLAGSLDLIASGGYRKAFTHLEEVKAHITASEKIITQLEIDISTAVASEALPLIEEVLE